MRKNYQAQLGHLASKLHLTDCHGIGLVEHHPNRLHTCDHHGNDRVVGIVDCQLQPASQVGRKSGESRGALKPCYRGSLKCPICCKNLI